jgi:RNA polymerase sigma-32 factor
MAEKNLSNKKRDKGEGSSLVRRDPIHAYLQEVARYPMLTPVEERDLAIRFRELGDIDAAKRLVSTHLRLVAKIAMEYRSAHHNILDLIQEGNVGLLHAVKNFDPDKGARLSSYATWWIKSYILKYIIDNFRMIKIGTTKDQKRLFYNLMQERKKLESEGYIASSKELSKRLGVAESAVIEMEKRLTTSEYALDAPVGSDKLGQSGYLKDFVAAEGEAVDEMIADRQTQDILKEKFEKFEKELNERDKKIFRERLLSELPLTLQDIAEQYGISKERVRQLEENLIKRLQKYFADSGIDASSLRI